MQLRSLFLLSVLYYSIILSNSVQVTLKDGQKTKADEKIILSKPGLLQCAYSRSTSGTGDAEIEWTYHTTASGGDESTIYRNGIIYDKWKDRFSIFSPSSLQISKTLVTDAGFYECKVIIPNDTPNTGKAFYNLTILVPPSQAVCQYPSGNALTLGFREELRCSSAQGIPPPTYTWYKDNQPLPTDGSADQRYKNTSFTYNPNTGTLVFSKVTTFDKGSYYCRSYNEVNETRCQEAKLTTKEQDLMFLIGIAIGAVCALVVLCIVFYCLYKKGYCASCCGVPSKKRQEHYIPDDVPLEDHYDDQKSEYSGYSAGKLRVQPVSEFDGSEKGRSLQEQKEFSRYSKERLMDAPSEYSSHSRSRHPELRDDRRLQDQQEFSKYSRERLVDDSSEYSRSRHPELRDDRSDYRDRRLQDQQEFSKYSRERLVDDSSEYSRSRRPESRDDRSDYRGRDDYRDRRLQDQQEYSKYSRERLVDNSSDYSRRTDQPRDRRLGDQAEYSRYSRERLDEPSDYGRERRLEDQREHSRYSRERLDDAPSEYSSHSRRPDQYDQRRHSLGRELDASSDYSSRSRGYDQRSNQNTSRYSMPVIDSRDDSRSPYAPQGGIRVMP